MCRSADIVGALSAHDWITEDAVQNWLAVNFSDDISEVIGEESLGSLIGLDDVDVSECSEECFQNLRANDFAPIQLAGLLYVFMEKALVKDSPLNDVQNGAMAASMYVRMCTLPNADFQHFHYPTLVEKALSVWRIAYRILVFGARDVSEVQAQAKGRKGKRKQISMDDGLPDSSSLPAEAMEKIMKEAARSLFIYLSKISLSGQDVLALSASSFTGCLARIDFHNRGNIDIEPKEAYAEFKRLTKFTDMSFALMHALCHGRHSVDCSLVYERIVQPRLLLWNWENSTFLTTIPADFTHLADAVLRFVAFRVPNASEEELKIIDELIFALIVRPPDKVDYRAKVPKIVLTLLKSLPRERLFGLRQMLWRLTARPGCLASVLELCVLLIREFDWSDADEAASQKPNETQEASTQDDVEMRDEADENEPEEQVDSDTDEAKKTTKKKNSKKPAKSAEELYFPKSNNVFYRIIIDSCVHPNLSVRQRALCATANLLAEKKHVMPLKEAAFDLHFAFNYEPSVALDDALRPGVNPTAADYLFKIIESTCKDAQSQVRKTASVCLEKYLPYAGSIEFSLGVNTLKQMCLDEKQVVRKQASESITNLVNVLEADPIKWHYIAMAWIAAVFPMIGDADPAVAEQIAGHVLKLVLTPLLEAAAGNVGGLAAEVIKRVYPGSSSRSDLIRALKDQASHQKLRLKVFADVQKKLESSPDSNDLWTLVDCLVRVFPEHIDANFVVNKWFSMTQPPRDVAEWTPMPTIPYGNMSRIILGIIRTARNRLTIATKKKLSDNLKAHINGNTVPTDFVNDIWLTLALLLDHQKGGDIEVQSQELREFVSFRYREALKILMEVWPAPAWEQAMPFLKLPILKHADTYIKRMICHAGIMVQYNLDCIYLTDQAEIANIRTTPLLVTLLMKLLTLCTSDMRYTLHEQRKTLYCEGEDPFPFGLPKREGGRWIIDGEWQAKRRLYSDVIVAVPAQIRIPRPTRAAAAAALGAHLVLDGDLGREYLPEIVQELVSNDEPSIRSSLLVPACDMMKRFANIHAVNLPESLACMLVDPVPLIRRQCLEMLTFLLKEQYLKWEGLVMHLYTAICVDENTIMASFAQTAVKTALLPILGDEMFYANFIEFILFYNNAPYTWDQDDGLVATKRRHSRVDGFKMSESRRFKWRQTVLRYVLTTFTDVQKFGTMVRLCTDILAPIVRGKFDITHQCWSFVVNDVLELMYSHEMSMVYAVPDSSSNGQDVLVAAASEENFEMPDEGVQTYKAHMMTILRTGITQKILPVMFDLLKHCETLRLAKFARKTSFTIQMLCKDHVDKIGDMLKTLCPQRASRLIAEIKDPEGFVQTELRIRERDQEEERAALLRKLLRENDINSAPIATPRIRRASIFFNAVHEHNVTGQSSNVNSELHPPEFVDDAQKDVNMEEVKTEPVEVKDTNEPEPMEVTASQPTVETILSSQPTVETVLASQKTPVVLKTPVQVLRTPMREDTPEERSSMIREGHGFILEMLQPDTISKRRSQQSLQSPHQQSPNTSKDALEMSDGENNDPEKPVNLTATRLKSSIVQDSSQETPKCRSTTEPLSALRERTSLELNSTQPSTILHHSSGQIKRKSSERVMSPLIEDSQKSIRKRDSKVVDEQGPATSINEDSDATVIETVSNLRISNAVKQSRQQQLNTTRETSKSSKSSRFVKLRLDDDDDVASTRPVPRRLRSSSATQSALSDETILEGRACSTPNKDPAAIDLTFVGLDFSVIHSNDPATAPKPS